MSIEQEIASWDGKSADDIKKIYDTHSAEGNFCEKVSSLLSTESCEKGATWLLKAWLEAGNELEQAQVERIYGLLGKLKNWEAKLHVLQSIPLMPITDHASDSLYAFLRVTLTDSNKFLRAWSYNGLYELSRQHSKYVDETKMYFEMAMRDEAPSVKARIRNDMKKGF